MAMAPKVKDILAVIAGIVRTAMNPVKPSSVKTVYTRRRFWRDQQQFRRIFERAPGDAHAGRVNGWHLYRTRTRAIETGERWRFYGIHSIELEGWMGVEDNPDQNFFSFDVLDEQGEAIRDAIRLSTSIFGNMEMTLPDTQNEMNCAPFRTFEVQCWRTVMTLEFEGIETKSL
jgi:hypothetical protein